MKKDFGSQALLSGRLKGRHWPCAVALFYTWSFALLSLSRICSSSERLVAGMWSVLWLSFGAAV